MASKILIRRANIKDISQIYNLGKKTKELEFSKGMTFHDRVELKEFIKKPRDNILLVSLVDKKISGFLYAKIVSRTWCILDNLVIDEYYRGHGIASLLLENLYKILKNKKVSYIQILEDIHHKKTREFWKRKGFIEEKKFIWADKII
jgi:N-acetylglutamate synthase-like GNAT family acetyltransferase